MTEYTRLCKTIHDFGRMIDKNILNNPTDLSKLLYDPSGTSWYRSLYYYSQKGKDYFEANGGSIKGYNGEVYSDRLYWDFDNKLDVEAAKKDVLTLMYRLNNDGVDIASNTRLYFSGNKGFHVEVLLNTKINPEDLKVICSNIAEGLSSFDPSLYNTNRIYRLQNTIHQESKLYKVELDPCELEAISITAIKERAAAPSNLSLEVWPAENITFLDKYRKVNKPTPKFIVTSDDNEGAIKGLHSIDFSQCPRHIPRCVFALEKGVMVPGGSGLAEYAGRNNAFLRLASYYRNQGMEKEVAYRALKGVAELNGRLYPNHDPVGKDELWNTVVNSVYSDNWKSVVGGPGVSQDDDVLKFYCDHIRSGKPCMLHSKNNAENSVVRISDVSDSFQAFAENIDKNTVKTGIYFLDKYARITTGTTNLLVGATGSGKTTLALNMLENANLNGLHSIFFSLDMHKTLVFLKLGVKYTNYSQDQILDYYKTRNTQKIEGVRKAISDHHEKTLFDFSTTVSLDQMVEKIDITEQKHGNKIKLVVVDYAGRLAGPYSDAYANARFNALKSVEVADTTNSAWLMINQISRNSGDGSSPLRSKRVAKDSGNWEESASVQFNVWRPFMGRESQDDIMKVYIAKNRMGFELERPLKWDGEKSIISDMNEMELAEYKQERESQEELVNKNKFDF